MIVSWYQFALFSNPDEADDSDLTNDGDFFNDINSELDWWDYQKETWLAIGMLHYILALYYTCVLCVCVCYSDF